MTQKRQWLLMILCAVVLGAGLPAAAQDDEFVYGVVLVGPENDRGWSQSHAEATQFVSEHIENTRAIVFESLNPADTPETTLLDVVTEMVADGAQLIFTTSDSFEEDTDTVAAQFPEVTFINITGSNALEEDVPPNVGNFNGMMEAPRALAGCAAALSTETGKIGYLGALINPETRRLSAASYLGARYCWETFRDGDPAALEFNVNWIGFWFHIPGVTLDPSEDANSFYDSGADVIISGIDTSEAIVVAGQRAAEGQSVFAIPYGNKNGCAEAPEACLGVAYYNWGPAYVDTILSVQDGTWVQAWEWLPPDWADINDPETSIIGYVDSDGLPEDVKPQLDAFYAEMAAYMTDEANAETLFLWNGPLNLQDGSELAPEGEPVALLDIWFLPQLLEGMTGASE